MPRSGTKATHLKLDELLKGVKGARTGMMDLENLSDEDLEQIAERISATSASEEGKETAIKKTLKAS